MIGTVILSEKNGKVTHFLDADFKEVDDIIVITQYIKDDKMGGMLNFNTVSIPKIDVSSVKYEC